LQENWNPALAEQLDADHQRACKSAASKCKKKPNIAYVKTIAALRTKKNVLLRVISQSKLGICMSESIAYQVRDGHNFRIPEDITACQVLLRTTRREISLLEKDAVTHRDNEQQEALREATKKGDKTTAKAIKFKMVAETTKRMFRKLQSC
jgi:hypothetical protein